MNVHTHTNLNNRGRSNTQDNKSVHSLDIDSGPPSPVRAKFAQSSDDSAEELDESAAESSEDERNADNVWVTWAREGKRGGGVGWLVGLKDPKTPFDRVIVRSRSLLVNLSPLRGTLIVERYLDWVDG